MNQSFLFYIAQNYSFEILRPLQQEILARGGRVLWFVYGHDVAVDKFTQDEEYTRDAATAIAFNPTATYVPGNLVPNFIPGLKVQVFHGLEWKKKGHFVIRGCFDLYCTHGNATTSRFKELAKKHGYFDVVETGWPKLDPLFTCPPFKWPEQTDKPVVLFAPTFSPALTSAPALFEKIKRLVEQNDWQWLVKFHPKMDPQWIAQYKQITGDNYQVIDDLSVSSLLQAADVLVSDTSSIIGEFALLGKPVVTLNNSQPGEYLIDIDTAEDLEKSIATALTDNSALKQRIAEYAQDLHPYYDGKSAQRILDATLAMAKSPNTALKTKPLNLFRNFKIRKKLKYWKF
mgnify:FL=1